MLVAHHLRVNACQIEVGGKVFAASRNDHLGLGWLAQQGLHDRLDRQQFKINRGVELVEDHGFVETA